MKNSLKVLAVLCVAALVFYACSDDDNDVAMSSQKVQFSFDLKSSTSGRTKEVPARSTLLISVQNASGNPVYNFKEFDLIRVGDQFITSPVELAVGEYRIIDFLIIDNTDQLIYAAPQSGSPLSAMVSQPLPLTFSVIGNQVSNVAVEVVSTTTHVAEDFGYASFNIKFKEGLPLSVNVLIMTGDNFQTTDATAEIFKDGSSVGTYSINPAGNVLLFPGDGTYTLVVTKSGYPTHSRTFVYSDLLAEQSGRPLSIILNEPSPYQLDGMTFHLDVTYSNTSVDGGVDYGTFWEQDQADCFFTIVHDTVVLLGIENEPGTITPGIVHHDSCTITAFSGEREGALNFTNVTGHVEYIGEITYIVLHFTHADTNSPEFSWICGSMDQFNSGGVSLNRQWISDAEFVFTNTHNEGYMTPDGFVSAFLRY